MPVSLSLIIPTIWRSTLAETLRSAVPQGRDRDEILIIGDHTGDYGCTACDRGIAMATGTHVFFCGDDDALAPDAFEIIRRGVEKAPDLPHLFAMKYGNGVLRGSFNCGEVSGQQIVVPRDMTKMPKMVSHSPNERDFSDWRFIQNVRSAWGNVVVHEEIIAILTQQNRGRML